MRNFPRVIKTKEDIVNCISDFGRERTILAFGDLLVDDTTVEVVTSYDPDPETGEMTNVVTAPVENPNPAWRRMGFESLADMLTYKEV
jgi:hypothetical protein